MAIDFDKVAKYNEELPSINSHDPLITWSSDFDFSYTICRFRTQMHKSSLISCFLFVLSNAYLLFNEKSYFHEALIKLERVSGLVTLWCF